MRKNIKGIVVVLLTLMAIGGVGYAAFGDRVSVLGTSVSVGNADLKLLNILSGGVNSENLVDSKPGPVFENITPNWHSDYGVKLFNNGSSDLTITSLAAYETANDTEELRQILFVEPFQWDDTNNDGVIAEGELGVSYGKKTIVKWKTEGYTLAKLSAGGVASYVLRFSTDAISDTKQGAQAQFDFYFDSLSGN